MKKSEIDHLITILFTFYCDDSFRRKYLRACLKSLNNALKKDDKDQINILVIDGSPLDEVSKNKFVFDNEITQIDVTYEFDNTQNPNKRISNHLKKFKSKYVLRLLEDCVFRCNDFSENIIKDCHTLEFLPKNSIIIYPFIDTDDIEIEDQILKFPLPDFETKKSLNIVNSRRLYNRREDRPHFNFITTSGVLYKKDFFIKHFNKYGKSSANLYETDDDIYSFRFFPLFIQRLIWVRIRSEIIKFLLNEYVIHHAFVSESCLNFNVIHIGVETLQDLPKFTVNSENRSNKKQLHQLSKFKSFDWDKGFEFNVLKKK